VRLNRADVDFIKSKVEACTSTQARNMVQVIGNPTTLPSNWAMNQAHSWASSVTSNVWRELEIKLREQEAFPPPDLSFWGFVRAFGESWTTMMSGPLTVPFTAAAVYFPGYPKLLFGLLAIARPVRWCVAGRLYAASR
jgi:hypothetical protein